MIIGFNKPAGIGMIARIDIVKGDEIYQNVPVMILREATVEEWLADAVDRYGEQKGRAVLAERLSQFPGAVFYDVSID
jgi:hypothetical protein